MTTNTTHKTSAEKALTPHLLRLEESRNLYARWVGREVFDALHRFPPQGTMKSWMQDHHGSVVDTVQVDVKTGSVWCPTGRTIDARSHSTRVSFTTPTSAGSGSGRDYAGMRVVAVSTTTLVVVDDWHAIAYVLHPESESE